MAINFPDNPTPTDTFTDAGKSWIWDGTTWKIYSSTSSGIGLGDLSVNTSSVGTAALSYNNTTGVFTYTPPDLSGYITSQYTLPTASTTVLGGVKVDGSTITINGSGVISGANTYSLPTATTTVLGGVKIDGTTITINNGVISGASSVPTSITVANEGADTTCFPLFTTAATGDLAPKTVTSLKLNSSSGQLEAGSFKKTGGTSSEFLKADGSIDSTTYLSSNPSYALNDLSNVDATTNLANGKILKYDLSTTSWILADDSGGSGSGGGNVAVGSIMIWSGATNNIPTGWQLCDGTNGSPDLRDKFIVGAGSTYAVDDTGGSKDAVVVEHEHTTNIDGGHVIPGNGGSTFAYGGAGTYSSTIFNMNAEGVPGTDKNLPPYYSLCYIYCTASGSNQNFIGLDDTPISHSNGKWLQSNGSSLVWVDAPSGGGTTINDNADNRIITGSSSATELNAESSLTYDGNILNFGDDKKIRYGSNFRMEMYADSTTGYIKLPADGSGAFPLEIHSGSSEVIKIDDGNTQILTGIKDKDGDLGSAGQILSSTGTQVNWIDASSGGSGGGNVAVGSIMIWSGATNNIPTGWQLCDGTNGSPDLRDKFVVGAGSTYSVDDTGGSANATLVSHSHTINNHTHDFSGSGSSSHNHGIPKGSGGSQASIANYVPSPQVEQIQGTFATTDATVNISISGTSGNPSDTGTNTQGSSATNANLPPYYSLCYIYCTSTGSNQTFVGLDDTPSSFTANKWLKVNSGGTALEWADAPSTDILADLSDVVISGSPTDDQVLAWDNGTSKWTNQTPSGGFSGNYNDLTNKPSLFSGSYNDLSNRPSLATVATSGDYNDLSNKPTISLPTTASRVLYNNGSGTTTTSANLTFSESTNELSGSQLAIRLSQNYPLRLGSGTGGLTNAPFELYYDGGNGVIHNRAHQYYPGDLYILNGDLGGSLSRKIFIVNQDTAGPVGSEPTSGLMAVFQSDGGQQLHWQGSGTKGSRLETTEYGILLKKTDTSLEGGHIQFEDSSSQSAFAIDVYGSTTSNSILRVIDQLTGGGTQRFCVNRSGAFGIGHVGNENYGSSGNVLISQGSGSQPIWGPLSSASSPFATATQGTKADANDTDIDDIYTQLVAIGNDNTITTVSQLKTALLALVRS